MNFLQTLPLFVLLAANVCAADVPAKLSARTAIREIQTSVFNGEARVDGISNARRPCVMTIESLEGRFPGIAVTISELGRKSVSVEITSPNATIERTRQRYLTQYKIKNYSEDYPSWISIEGFEDIRNFNLTLMDGKANTVTCLFTK